MEFLEVRCVKCVLLVNSSVVNVYRICSARNSGAQQGWEGRFKLSNNTRVGPLFGSDKITGKTYVVFPFRRGLGMQHAAMVLSCDCVTGTSRAVAYMLRTICH